MVNCNVLVKSKNNANAARKMLAEALFPGHPECLDSTSLDFIKEMDYITALPVEVALSITDRAKLREQEPTVKWIITGVNAEDVSNLVANYGYKVLEPKIEIHDPTVEALSKDCTDQENNSYFSINGKEVTEEEFTNKLEKVVCKVFERNFKPFKDFLDLNWF